MVATDSQASQASQTAKDIHRAELFEGMLRTEAWSLYEELLNTLIGNRTQTLFEPTPAGGELAEQHNKGAVYWLIQARDLLRSTVAGMKAFRDLPDGE